MKSFFFQINIHVYSPWNENLKLLVRIKFYSLFYIYIYIYIYLNKNWKIYWSKQSCISLGPEDWCSLWGLCTWSDLSTVYTSCIPDDDTSYCLIIKLSCLHSSYTFRFIPSLAVNLCWTSLIYRLSPFISSNYIITWWTHVDYVFTWTYKIWD